MSQPGWYQDPSGRDGHYRYWDGAAWAPQTTTDPHAAGDPAGGRPPPRKTPLILALVAGFLALSFVAWWFLLRPGDQGPQLSSSESTTSTQPSEKDSTPGATQTSDDLCTGGNQRYLSATKLPQVVHSGLAIDYPQEWVFRLDKSQFPWLDDPYPFGHNTGKEEATLIIGRQPPGHIQDTALAAQQQWRCWTTQGFLKSEEFPQDLPAEPTAITTSGVKGHEYTSTLKAASGDTLLTMLRVYDHQGYQVVFIGYTNRPGSALEKTMVNALNSIRPQ